MGVMMGRKMLLGLSFICTLFIFATPVYAQLTVDPQAIVKALAPRPGVDLLLDLLLYGIFGIAFITMLLVPDKQLVPSLIMVGVILAALIAKLGITANCNLETLALNVSMFAFPLLVAGMVRARGGKTPPAMWPAIVTGIVGGIYFFLFWALKQQTCPNLCIGCLSTPEGGGARF
ncbi:MAG: hypothetical protein IT298_11040 [Chloroflexi bacterium]|nr:hypothetical protein [Chloroflexota bacterium]